jgi:hypothetical protein
MTLTSAEQSYLAAQPRGRLATIAPNGPFHDAPPAKPMKAALVLSGVTICHFHAASGPNARGGGTL